MRIKSAGYRGFSLLEVLIGVLVLALALLGLAALFPVVLRDQREARDGILGVSAQRAAEAYLTTQLVLNPGTGTTGWRAYANRVATRPDNHKWEVTLSGNDTVSLYRGGDGQMRMLGNTVTIPVVDRVWPNVTTTAGTAPQMQPQLVWDIAVCATTEQVTQQGGQTTRVVPLRVAIFTRRVDAQIRVPAGSSVASLLRARAVVPVAVDADGLPVLNGVGTYAPVLFADVQSVQQSRPNGPLDTLVLANASNSQNGLRLAAQIGQKLVENSTGAVYTVVEATGNRVRVEPAVNAQSVDDANNGDLQVAYTAQIPVAVSVIEIRR